MEEQETLEERMEPVDAAADSVRGYVLALASIAKGGGSQVQRDICNLIAACAGLERAWNRLDTELCKLACGEE